MRRLTLRGFLDSYVPYLAGEQTLDPARLVHASKTRSRMVPALLLWGVVNGRAETFKQLFEMNPERLCELDSLLALSAAGKLEQTLAAPTSAMRTEYHKVMASYLSRRDAPVRDADVKRAARQRALELEKSKRVTRYRLAKDLGLNPGNLHAFLTQGNVSKLSRANALAVVDYLRAA